MTNRDPDSRKYQSPRQRQPEQQPPRQPEQQPPRPPEYQPRRPEYRGRPEQPLRPPLQGSRYQPQRQSQRQPQPNRELQEKTREWKSFDALPPAPKIAYPRIDTRTQTESQTDTATHLASLKKRAGAFAIDFGIGLGVSYFAQALAALGGGGAEAIGVMGYGAFFATWMVNRGYWQSRTGQSAGKWALNIKTVDTQTDEPPSLIRSVAREGVSSLLIATEALGVPLVADSLFAIFDKEKRQSLHDRAARTQVINCEEGYQLDEKLAEFLEEGEAGEFVEDVKGALGDLVSQVGEDESVRDAGKNAKTLGRKAGKQMRNWVENLQDKLDNL
ncbi:RDD family protein [Synechococcus sp. PCC 7336]|uniref:RDD family protein n=1 Tax=Synechococcus sp. PCC 7336 TaxID=195250 RepID=UPI0003473A99|nr:RDD family protein [Synechococcus sp. PCC 7336]